MRIKFSPIKANSKTLKALLFAFAVCICVPPLFVRRSTISWRFPFEGILYAAFSAVLCALYGYKIFPSKSIHFVTQLAKSTLALGELFIVQSFFVLLSIVFPLPFTDFPLPEREREWLFVVLTFAFSAFNEEVLYRAYLLDLFKAPFLRFYPRFAFFSEIFAAALFSFSHLYLGYFSFLNALFSHAILRILFRFNRTLWGNVAVHFIYNFVSIIFICFIKN